MQLDDLLITPLPAPETIPVVPVAPPKPAPAATSVDDFGSLLDDIMGGGPPKQKRP